MLPELTNLLPPERKVTLSREYLFRFGTCALVFLSALIVVHAALLVPTYAYVLEDKAVQEERVTELSLRREVSGFTDLSARVTALSERATMLEELRTLPSGSDVIRAVLALPRGGVSLSSFVYAPPNGSEQGYMRIGGTALTRESLRAFDSALGSLSFVRSRELPLSAYAREKDIPFEIALTLDFATP